MNGVDIKKNRKKLGLTQKELSDIIRVSRKTISSYENGDDIPKSKQILFEKIFSEQGHISNNENSIINHNVIAEEIYQDNLKPDNNELVEFLKKQIEIKDKQIMEKDRQLEESEKMLQKLIEKIGK